MTAQTQISLYRIDGTLIATRDVPTTKALVGGLAIDRVSLARANLRGADLTDANLTDANLTDANLTDADLTDANLSGAKVTEGTVARLLDARSLLAYHYHAVLLTDGRIILQYGCERHALTEWRAQNASLAQKRAEGTSAEYVSALVTLFEAIEAKGGAK